MQYVLKICGQANFFTYFLPYTGFFLAGYYFGLTKLQVKKRWIIFTYLISLFLTILGGYVYYLLKKQDSTLLAHPGCLSFYTDSYLSINVTLMAVTLFILLMHTSFSWIKNNYAKRLIYSVARSSMGIFLIHTLILDILDRKFHLFDQITPIWLYLIIKVFVIFVLSYLLTLVIVRIPFVKRMLGEMK